MNQASRLAEDAAEIATQYRPLGIEPSEELGRAITLAQKGEFEKAVANLDTIEEPPRTKHDRLVERVEDMAWAGKFDDAILAAKGFDNTSTRTEASSRIGQELTRVGQLDKARNLLKSTFSSPILDGRSSFFTVLQNGATTLALLDNGKTLWQIYQAIQEVDGWWE